MQKSKRRYINDDEIERITLDLLAEGYDEDRIIDHLDHINEQRRKREENKPEHISKVIGRIVGGIK